MSMCLCLLPLGACAEFGAGPAGGADEGAATGEAASPAAPATAISADLLPAPTLFEATGTARWDGRRTLQGVWVAHPQAGPARRVRIYNEATGAAADGALFKRDAVLAGPSMLVSSDAARLLGIAPGEDADLRVVAVTPRAEGETLAAAAPAPSAVSAPASPRRAAPRPVAPAKVVARPLPGPEAGRAARTAADAQREAVPALAAAEPAAPPPAPPAIAAAREEPAVPAAAVPASDAAPGSAAASSLAQPYVQAGLFAVAGNAERLIGRLEAEGLPALARPARLEGGAATRVLAGPFATESERDAARRRIQAMGLGDAIPVAR